MFKKVSIILGCFILCTLPVLIGCSHVGKLKNNEKIVINQTAQKGRNDIKNSAVPNFEEIYNSTIEIDVNFASNSMYGNNKNIEIKDGKMLSDILSMIGKSQLITDESKIKSMSGMAAKDNKLILIAKDGNKTEIKFAFDDPAFAVGYLEINEKKYDPSFSFFRYIKDLLEYRKFDPVSDNSVEALFKKYNWTIDYKVNTINVTLPSDLKHEAGEYPVKIYWAYNNELSKSIGLDYSGYLGKKIETSIYRLREPLPDYMSPRMNSRGIVLKYDEKIIGAYIDAGRHNNFACSLDRKNLKDITNKDWDNWISDYINFDNEIEIKLSKMKPEEIIKQYYNAINSHNEKLQYACMTRHNICNYLAMNMDNNLLFNKDFSTFYSDGISNIVSAKLINSKEVSASDNLNDTVQYAVTIDFKFKKVITSESRKQMRFITLKKESQKSGWRIESEGTGP